MTTIASSRPREVSGSGTGALLLGVFALVHRLAPGLEADEMFPVAGVGAAAQALWAGVRSGARERRVTPFLKGLGLAALALVLTHRFVAPLAPRFVGRAGGTFLGLNLLHVLLDRVFRRVVARRRRAPG